jgi:hypothetical protein
MFLNMYYTVLFLDLYNDDDVGDDVGDDVVNEGGLTGRHFRFERITIFNTPTTASYYLSSALNVLFIQEESMSP